MTGPKQGLQVRYVQAPLSEVTEAQFALESCLVLAPGDGEILVEGAYLSVDPYQRRQMMPGVQYAQPLRVGDIMTGRAIGRVMASGDARFAEGDWVRGPFGWRTHPLVRADLAERIELDGFRPQLHLGALGSPGLTAWVGIHRIANVKSDETTLISAATGAVGSVAAALAAARGSRVVGVAGGSTKCAYACEILGYDACIDHKDPDFGRLLEQATPNGIDVDFENVGGRVFDAVLTRLNDFARVALCGLVSQYNLPDPDGLRNLAALLNHNVLLQGFRVSNYQSDLPEAMAAIKDLLRTGLLQTPEAIVQGLQSAPAAFIGMLKGNNLGKQLVRLSP